MKVNQASSLSRGTRVMLQCADGASVLKQTPRGTRRDKAPQSRRKVILIMYIYLYIHTLVCLNPL